MSCITKCGIVLTTPKRAELLQQGPSKSMCNRCHILGRGSFGTVFKAIYHEHSVALKLIKSSAMSTLHNEAHVLNWRHRNIVRLLKLESTPQFGLIIMERSNGLCLQRVLDTLALPLLHRVLITLDVLSALRYCHYQNVLHLDVKPANILITLGTTAKSKSYKYNRSYICKLCDFGCSLKIGEFADNSNVAKGTLRYMSPEALCSGTLTTTSDIYSLGITMWQLQARRLPFYTLSCNETIAYQVVKHQLRPDNYIMLAELATDQDKSLDLIYNYLNHNLIKKARRNLKFETRKRVNFKRKKPSKLSEYFQNPLKIHLDPNLESSYTDLYRNCWYSQPELRLSSFQLLENLELILSKLIN